MRKYTSNCYLYIQNEQYYQLSFTFNMTSSSSSSSSNVNLEYNNDNNIENGISSFISNILTSNDQVLSSLEHINLPLSSTLYKLLSILKQYKNTNQLPLFIIQTPLHLPYINKDIININHSNN